MDQFLSKLEYVRGKYDDQASFEALNTYLNALQKDRGFTKGNRIFYLALPPSVFQSVTALIKTTCWSQTGWNRLIIEKPFGKDSESHKELSDVSSLFLSSCRQVRVHVTLPERTGVTEMLKCATSVHLVSLSYLAVAAYRS